MLPERFGQQRRGGGLRLGQRRRPPGRRVPVHQEHPVAVRRREAVEQVALGHEQFPLEDAVPERPHQPQLHRRAAFADRVGARLADRPLQDIGHGILVAHHRDRLPRRPLPPQEAPGVVVRLRGLAQMGGEGEAVLFGQVPGNAEDPRSVGAVEVQATRVLVPGETQRPHPEAARVVGRVVREAQRFPALRGIRVPGDAEHRLGHGEEAAGARRDLPRVRPFAEGLDRHQQEGGESDHRQGGQTAPGTERRSAERQSPHPGEGTGPGGRAEAAADEEQGRGEQQTPGAEEPRSLRDDTGRRQGQQRAGPEGCCRAGEGSGPARRGDGWPGTWPGVLLLRGRDPGDRARFAFGPEVAGEQRPGRPRKEPPQRPPGAEAGHLQPAERPGAHRLPADEQLQRRRRAPPSGVGRSERPPERPAPDAGQESDHPAGVGDAEERADRRPEEGDEAHFGQQERGHPPPGPAGGEQQADLPEPPLDPQAEQEDDQDERRGQQEEGEVEEVEPEVGGAPRGLDPLLPHRDRREAEGGRVEGAHERRGEFVERFVGRSVGARPRPHRRRPRLRGEAHRSRAAPAGGGQPARRGQRQERLRQRPPLLPVVLVLPADAVEIHRERRIPVADPRRVRHPRVLRGERRIRRQPGPFPGRRGPEGLPRGAEPALRLPGEELDLDRIAGPQVEVLPEPGSGDQPVGRRREQPLREARDQGVGRLALAGAEGPGEPGQHRVGEEAPFPRRGRRRRHCRFRENQAPALEHRVPRVAAGPRPGTQREPEVLERRHRPQGRPERLCRRALRGTRLPGRPPPQEQRVRPQPAPPAAAPFDRPGEIVEAQEDRPHRPAPGEDLEVPRRRPIH